MEVFDRILLAIHIPAGFLSLVLFILPVFMKKGRKNHIRFGWAYVYCMWVVVITSIILSINNVIVGNYVQALFLGFLGFLTAKPLWYGIAILKSKKGFSNEFKSINMLLNGIVFGLGLFNLVYGLSGQAGDDKILLIIFGVLGLTIGKDLLRKEIIPANSNFIIEHLRGMVIAGIAAYTAFFTFGGRTIFGDIFVGNSMLILWISPTILGVIIINYFKPKYRKVKKLK